MPRAVSTDFARAHTGPEADQIVLAFAEFWHPRLGDEAVRIVNDLVDYVWTGKTWTAMPFRWRVLSDGERTPRATIAVSNVDRRLGQIVADLDDAVRLTISVLTSASFDMTVTPRMEVASPVIEYQARQLRLRRVSVDATTVEADLYVKTPEREPWPWIRTTKDKAPGLYW